MKKIVISCIIAIGICSPQILFGVELSEKITVGGTTYTYFDAYMLIDEALEVSSGGDIFTKYESYVLLKKDTLSRYKEQDIFLYKQLAEVLQIGINSISYELTNTVHKVRIGSSEQGRDIYAYVKGIPENGYKLIVSNIHGAYEYGTYETANMLLEELEQSDANGWIIIPSLNPDGLQEYIQKGTGQSTYLHGRDNSNNVDLNRNFCSSNFMLGNFDKYGKIMKTGREGCESESETRALTAFMKNFPITRVISLHSTGGIFYIPDNSIQDSALIRFVKEIHSLLPDYDFYPDFSTQESLSRGIIQYEMDEGGKGIYTGTLENYVYEAYGIPAVLIELSNHGRVEERLRGLLYLDF